MTASEHKPFPIRVVQGAMASMEKMMPPYNDITFWLVANVILFLYVGIFELANGYGPGTFYSAGAVILAVIYLLLWMFRRTNKKMADQWIMILSGLAILGDLIVIGYLFGGSFSGGSALLDAVGLMLFRATYMEYRGPM
ncbi:MAG: hypothetical protein JRN06_09590 [Nitrososphaerota archaeon]|nr:hypothetical protein [Nitrososphaerota archaeon]MDG7024838.1 hypothetical protein [Nitrososphaerota archaeon]